MEDRLFRDETQIEVNKFILICREHDTLVVTPHMTYDFNNPYHVKQFRWKCEQAADFLREYIRERLHAEVVRYIFNRFIELGGNVRKLFRELLKNPVLFPDFDASVDARTVSRLILRKVPGGYHISCSGLKTLLTNIAYIGWWIHQDTIVRDNHPAIIEEEFSGMLLTAYLIQPQQVRSISANTRRNATTIKTMKHLRFF
jgi:hypothetical protein